MQSGEDMYKEFSERYRSVTLTSPKNSGATRREFFQSLTKEELIEYALEATNIINDVFGGDALTNDAVTVSDQFSDRRFSGAASTTNPHPPSRPASLSHVFRDFPGSPSHNNNNTAAGELNGSANERSSLVDSTKNDADVKREQQQQQQQRQQQDIMMPQKVPSISENVNKNNNVVTTSRRTSNAMPRVNSFGCVVREGGNVSPLLTAFKKVSSVDDVNDEKKLSEPGSTSVKPVFVGKVEGEGHTANKDNTNKSKASTRVNSRRSSQTAEYPPIVSLPVPNSQSGSPLAIDDSNAALQYGDNTDDAFSCAGSVMSFRPPGRGRSKHTTGEMCVDSEGFQTINDYVFLDCLGKGINEVMLAFDQRTDDQVAIKILPLKRDFSQPPPSPHTTNSANFPSADGSRAGSVSPQKSSHSGTSNEAQQLSSVQSAPQQHSASAIHRTKSDLLFFQGQYFVKEVAIMKKIAHRNIVHLHEAIIDPVRNKLYLVLDYIQGGPLLSINSKNTCNAIPEVKSRSYLKQICNALEYLHNRNIVHRDIKPDNILLSRDGSSVFVTDFGVSEVVKDLEVRGHKGTPVFFAPELLDPHWVGSVAGPAVDMWALGVTYYAMLFGQLPFVGATYAEVRESILNHKMDFEGLPCSEESMHVLKLLLEVDPEKRMTAQQLRKSKCCKRNKLETALQDAAVLSASDGNTLSSPDRHLGVMSPGFDEPMSPINRKVELDISDLEMQSAIRVCVPRNVSKVNIGSCMASMSQFGTPFASRSQSRIATPDQVPL